MRLAYPARMIQVPQEKSPFSSPVCDLMNDTDQPRWDAITFCNLLEINSLDDVVTLYHVADGYTIRTHTSRLSLA